MKLIDLTIEGKTTQGWSSGLLMFGNHITELYGANGSGKTPIIQSIAFALGYPVKFREDIYTHCEATILSVQLNASRVVIRRSISAKFDILVQVDQDLGQSFYVEKDFSRFLFDQLGFDFTTLVSTANEPVTPYMSTILPLFYLDQDTGYQNAYRAPTTFIKDQYAEMMRIAFGIPSKHSFDRKKLLIDKKARLDALDRQIVSSREFIETVMNELSGPRRPLDAIDSDVDECRAGLTRLRGSRATSSDAASEIDVLLVEQRVEHRALLAEISDLQGRVDGFDEIRNDIDVEVRTLSLNDEARRLFTSFEEICSTPGCGLFLGSSESYGKSLLYLRDQLKDLERNSVTQKARIDHLQALATTKELSLRALGAKRDTLLGNDELDGIVEAIGQYTRRLFDLEKEKKVLEELNESEQVYVRRLTERESVQNDISAMSSSGGDSDLRSIEIRSALRARVVHWLDALGTKNVSRDAKIDADFNVTFGDERMSQFHGSTLVRVVLAIRTATFEMLMKDKAQAFRCFILDTPRQQDIDRLSLAGYVEELKQLAKTCNAQIIFSTTDYHYECGDGDQEWVAQFAGVEQPMFLRQS